MSMALPSRSCVSWPYATTNCRCQRIHATSAASRASPRTGTLRPPSLPSATTRSPCTSSRPRRSTLGGRPARASPAGLRTCERPRTPNGSSGRACPSRSQRSAFIRVYHVAMGSSSVSAAVEMPPGSRERTGSWLYARARAHFCDPQCPRGAPSKAGTTGAKRLRSSQERPWHSSVRSNHARSDRAPISST